MKYPFESPGPLIIATIKLEHGNRSIEVPVALDTGAVTTVVNSSIAEYLGCYPSSSEEKRKIVTASGIEWCAIAHVDRITACGRTLENVEVLCHDLPAATKIRGLLMEDCSSKIGSKIE